MSNGEAFQRLTVARLARQFPVIFDLIERREVHVSGLCLLRDYLTSDNHLELLAGASHKTKFQILEMLARRFPRPDVASTTRKLPSTPAARVNVVPASRTDIAPARAADQFATPTPMPAERAVTAATAATAATAELRLDPPRPKQSLEPLSEARYRLQLNVTASMREKLELARALLSHSVPSGDFAELLERALDELIAKTQKQRFAQTKSPRGATSAKPAGKRESRVALRRDAAHCEHIPNATQRAVIARDGLRCTFVSEDGCRCASSSFLQLHHEQPWAKGGESTQNNLRLLCAAHNRFLAEQDFGRDVFAARRDEGRRIACGGHPASAKIE